MDLEKRLPKESQSVTLRFEKEISEPLVLKGLVDEILTPNLYRLKMDSPYPTAFSLQQSATLSLTGQDAEYHFPCIIDEIEEPKESDEKVKTQSVVSIIVKIAGSIRRVQRRNFFRLDVRIPLQIKSAKLGTANWIRSETHDLSANGVALSFENPPFAIDEAVQILCQTEALEFATAGKVVRKQSLPKNKTLLGIEFSGLSETDRAKILKFLMDEERRRKNLLK